MVTIDIIANAFALVRKINFYQFRLLWRGTFPSPLLYTCIGRLTFRHLACSYFTELIIIKRLEVVHIHGNTSPELRMFVITFLFSFVY